jgi:hypothetical protein
MKESKALDEDGLAYPDPLSVNYVQTQLSSIPKRRVVSETDIQRFWLFMHRYYAGLAEADDILLTLNNIPYKGMLNPGDNLYLVEAADLYSFATQKKPS